MARIIRKIKVSHKEKDSRTNRHASVQRKETRRPGLDNDAVFKDSARSIDVCI